MNRCNAQGMLSLPIDVGSVTLLLHCGFHRPAELYRLTAADIQRRAALAGVTVSAAEGQKIADAAKAHAEGRPYGS